MFSVKKKELLKSKEVYLVIKARPGASFTKVKEVMDDGVFKVDIAAIPEKNKANKELIKYLASVFEVSKVAVKIISGAGEKKKMIKIIK